jgi:hypothetical protein
MKTSTSKHTALRGLTRRLSTPRTAGVNTPGQSRSDPESVSPIGESRTANGYKPYCLFASLLATFGRYRVFALPPLRLFYAPRGNLCSRFRHSKLSGFFEPECVRVSKRSSLPFKGEFTNDACPVRFEKACQNLP